MKHTTLSVFDHVGGKVCDQYDSDFKSPGQAHTICLTKEINGWKELSFVLPYMVEKKSNFRWKYIRNEYRQRVRCGDWEDWFTITRPKGSKSSGQISNTVVCYHLSSVLKTKNLYLQFDDENGIDTCGNLVTKALSGTGWSLGLCDIFYESDGKTEKIRSLSSTGKVGSYQLITNICGLFNAYPVYNGATKTVDIHALSNKLPQEEMIIGHNLTALSVELDSDSIVTRLYVEGEYGEDGYVGIDDVNPTGLSYLLNFDYYKEIGLFGDAHQAALDTYLADISETNNRIKELAAQITKLENDLNTIWGQPQFVYYVAGQPYYFSADMSEENKKQSLGQEVYVLQLSGDYYVENYSGGTGNDMVKFLTKSSYSMGSKEVAVEAKQKLIKSLEEDLQSADEEDKPAIEEKIQSLRSEITGLYTGTSESEGLYSLMSRASVIIKSLKAAKDNLSVYQLDQARIETEFSETMGDLLKDGYWANNNYIEGQEEFLYADALEMSTELTKPTVTYSISLVQASDIWGEVDTEFFINSKVRIYDPELQVNDIVFVTKTVEYLDDESKGSVEISNDDLSIVGKSFDSILGRITQLADMIDQKTALIDRADVIGKDGTISVVNLEGQIDLLKNKLISSTSNWYTDDNGNIIFLSVNGRSAMMLSGEGFMIANGKTSDGEWNWRTFGTGEGFTADLITAGTISADRIKTGSIGVSKLSADLAETIQKTEILMEPGKITSIVRSSEEYQNDLNEAANSQKVKVYRQQQDPNEDESITLNEGDLWIKTSADGNDLEESYVWDGSAWSPLTDNEHISGLETRVTELSSQIEQTNQNITITVEKKVEEVVKGEVENFIGDAVDDVIGDSAQEAVDNALAKGMDGYVKTEEMESAIDVASGKITSSVSSQIKVVTDNNEVIRERQTKAEEKITPESIVDTVTTSDTFTTQYATREQTATAIEQAVGEVNGEVSSLKQTSNAIEARVSTNEKDIGQLKQTSEKFETQISDAEGNISRLEQDADQFKISVGQDIEAKTSDATGQQMTLSFDRGGSVEVEFETLTCHVHVYKNGEEVTGQLPLGAFSWKRSSGDASQDAAWNAKHKATTEITLEKEDIGKSCQITCELNAMAEFYGQFMIEDGILYIKRSDGTDDSAYANDAFELKDTDLWGDESYYIDEEGFIYKNGVPGQMSVSTTVFDHTMMQTSHILIKDEKIQIQSGGDIEVQAEGTLTLKGKAALNVESGGNINIASKANVNVEAEGNIHLSTGGTFTTESEKFTVDSDGNVKMTGNITATGGDIAGWQIKDGYLASGSGSNHVRLSTDDPTYAIWAGDETKDGAPFKVAKDGSVYLSKLYITDEKGDAQERPVNLNTSYWKVDRAYDHAVKSMTANGDTLTITLYNGEFVTFKKAVGVGTDGQGRIYPVDASGERVGTGESSIAIPPSSVSLQGWSDPSQAALSLDMTLDGSPVRSNYIVVLNLSEVYEDGAEYGWKDAAGQWKVNSGDTSFTVNTASPTAVGTSDTKTFTMTKGEPSATGGYAAVSHNSVAVARIDISDWWNEGHDKGRDSVSIETIDREDGDEYLGDSNHNTRVFVIAKASNGAVNSETLTVSGASAYSDGRADAAASLKIDPSTPTTLDYGKTVSVTASAIGKDNYEVKRTVNITAPADRYNQAYTDAAPTGLSQASYSDKNYTINVNRLDGTTRGPFSFSGKDAYDDGWDSVNVLKPARQRQDAYVGGDNYATRIFIVATAKNGKSEYDSFDVSGVTAYNKGRDDGANSLAISPAIAQTLDYGKTVTVSATTENGSGQTVTKSVDITAPAAVTVENVDRVATYNSSSIAYEVDAKVKLSDGTTKDFELAPISAMNAYNEGKTSGANTLTLEPANDQSLDYGETVTVVASVEDGYGNHAQKSVDITAPADRYKQGVTDGANSLTLTAPAEKLGFGGSTTVTATTTNGNGQPVTKKVQIKAAGSYTNAQGFDATSYEAGKSEGIQTVKDDSTLSISGADLTATVEATYADSAYKSLPLNGFYTNAFNKGAGAAIDASSLTQTVDDDGKTATGVISTVGIDGTKEITGIDVSDAYDIGRNAGKPISVDRVATYNSSTNSYDITVKVKLSDGTTIDFDLESVSASRAYNTGWNSCRSAMNDFDCIVPSTSNSDLYYANGQPATGTWYQGSKATLYSKPTAK